MGYKIKGYEPLNSDPAIVEIKCWLVSNGYLRLSDISTWNRDRKWAAWEFPALPGHSDSLLHS